MVDGTGLRERKKQATRKALREAALRLATERGPENVRVDDIAGAAGVSPRTYNNYYSSREQAIVAAVTAERDARVVAAVTARSPDVRLADAVVDAIVEQYTEPDERGRAALLLVTTNGPLRTVFVESTGALEDPLAAVLEERLNDDGYAARVLAASVAAAVGVALRCWLRSTGDASTGGLVVTSGRLPEVLRAALEPLAPAFDAAERRAVAGS